MNEEIIQEIKQTIPWFIVAALAVAGYYGVKNYRENRRAESSAALVQSYTTGEFESAVSKYGSTAAGGALKLRLAKKYYDDGRYDEAIAVYDGLSSSAPDGFADIPAVGKAHCLEAKGDYAAALAAYDGFAAANPGSFLAFDAKLGAIRATALGGDREKALSALAALKESVKGDDASKLRVEQLEDALKRLPVAGK